MRFPIKVTLAALLAVFLWLPAAFSLDRPTPVMAQGRGERFHRLERFVECLSILGLSEEQRSQIRGVLEAARPAFQAAREGVRAAREKLDSDVAAGAGACLVGEDYLALRAAVEALRGELTSIRDEVLSKLTPEQAAKLAGCLEAPAADAAADEGSGM
ncbi:MAG: Spy/CpxP family protein refolding chaperone [Thermoanaerobaculia bacterium]